MEKPNKTGRYGKHWKLGTGKYEDAYMQEVLGAAWRLGGIRGAMEICAEEGWDYSEGQLKYLQDRYGWRMAKRYTTPHKHDDIVYETIEMYYPKGGSPKVIEELEKLGYTGYRKGFIGSVAYRLGLNSPLKHKANKGSRKKGDEPTNKNRPMLPSQYKKCKVTMFKKGSTPPNRHYVGAIRTRMDRKGRVYLYIKFKHGLRSWEILQRWVYTTFVGKIPAKHIVTFKPGCEHFIWHPLNPELRKLEPLKSEQWVLDSIDPLEVLEHIECISMKKNAKRNHNPVKAKKTLGSLTDRYIIGRQWRKPDYQELLQNNKQLLQLERTKMFAQRKLKQLVSS